VKQEIASTISQQPVVYRELDRLSGLTQAAGHGFNDELTFILNHADVSLGLVGAGHPASVSLIELQRSALRCAEISRGLLSMTERAREAVRCAKVKHGAEDHPGHRDIV
jgi:hypothetical protein